MSETPKDDDPDAKAPDSNGKNGIMDDIILLIFLIPILGVFLPQFRGDIQAGFDVLSNIPDWFSFIIVLGVLSILGFRKQLIEILSNFTNFRKK